MVVAMSALDIATPARLLEVRDLCQTFTRRRGLPFIGRHDVVRAVDRVSLDVTRGETLGLVGESGSGKSTLGRAILRLVPPTSGSVLFEGHDLARASASELRLLRRRMQIVFQDPYSSLHPRMTVRQTIRDGLRAGGEHDAAVKDQRVAELLQAVGLGPAHAAVYPHQLSGGQRQRVAIARALSVKPSFIVADEPVSALDVSIQAQILNLLADLQRTFGLTFLFISHDLNVIRYLADRVAVMYRGRIVEQAPATSFFASPQHPYSRLLFDAMPHGRTGGKNVTTQPRVEAPVVAPASGRGCAFHARCPHALPSCLDAEPPLRTIAPGHAVACFRAPL
jgi:oligopeptide/dipeptide ABC transporter ATP-binding protein